MVTNNGLFETRMICSPPGFFHAAAPVSEKAHITETETYTQGNGEGEGERVEREREIERER